jgi:2-keto-4-pentenoate hydratase
VPAPSNTRQAGPVEDGPVVGLSSRLASAHAGGARLTAGDAVDLTPAEAYEVQATVARGLGRRIGWKVGRKSPAGPFSYAPLFDDRMHASGVALARDAFQPWMIEAELMVRFRRGLPATGAPHGQDRVRDAIGEVMAALEVIDSRFAAWPDVAPPLLVADLLSHGTMVFGSGTTVPAGASFETAPVRLTIDGKAMVDQRGGNPAGNLIDLVTLLVDRLAESGTPIREGDLVTTGSFTGMRVLPPGGRAEATFEGIGSVALTRSA